jgi:hypothetical protein
MKKSASLWVLLIFIMLDVVYGVSYLAMSAIRPKVQQFQRATIAQSLVISGNAETAASVGANKVATDQQAGDAYRTAASQAEDTAIDQFYQVEQQLWDATYGGS